MKHLPRKVIYSRKSSDKSDLENQITNMKHKWGHDLEEVQETKSGQKRRPKLMELLDTLPPGSTIYVMHRDRLTRSGIADYFVILGIAERRKITIESYSQGVLGIDKNDAEGQLLASIGTYVAQKEAQETSRRVREMFDSRSRRGLKSGVYLAIEKGTWKYGTKEVNPKITAATPRIHELRAKRMKFRDIKAAIDKEFDHSFSLSWIHEISKRPYAPAS